MSINKNITETYLNRDFPQNKEDQYTIIKMFDSIYCEKSASAHNSFFSAQFSYEINWDDPTKCTVFLKITPRARYILPIPKRVPVKYMAGGQHQFYVNSHFMTCSRPSSMYMYFDINRTKFKTPAEMYNYITDVVSIAISHPLTKELHYIPLRNFIGHISN